MMDDLISRQAAIDAFEDTVFTKNEIRRRLSELPSAQPERLTDDDFETIRIHLNAYKENLCNQHRWKEAEEYQHIIDRFMAFASAEPEREKGEWVLHNKNFKNLQFHTCSNCGARARTILTGTRLVDNYYCYKSEPITEYEFDEELSNFCPNCGADMRGENNER